MKRCLTALTVALLLAGCKEDIESQLIDLQDASDARMAGSLRSAMPTPAIRSAS
ncbi:MAG: hypothetical protein AAFY14_16100 [Pseudomonadota bacterium]